MHSKVLGLLLLCCSTFAPVYASPPPPIHVAEWEVAAALRRVAFPAAPKKLEDGLVVLKIQIDVDGAVVFARTDSGDRNLGRVVEPAVLRWRYSSFDVDGKSAAVETKLAVVFVAAENRYYTQARRCVVFAPPGAEVNIREIGPDSESPDGIGRIDVPENAHQKLRPEEVVVPDGVIAGKALRRPQPYYPEAAHRAGVGGSVVVLVLVGKSGLVLYAVPIEGHLLLQVAATEAARRWEFSPTTRDNARVNMIGTLTFNFRR